MGEEKMSLCSSTTLSTFFYSMERPIVEAMDLAATFHSLSTNHEEENLPSLRDDLHALFRKMKEIDIGRTTSGIM
jgi:hypothetical protein